MDNQGWIKLHRKITKWEWYTDANTARVFLHLMLTANQQEKTWKGTQITRGQVVTSRSKLAESLGISEQNVRTALANLQSTGELTSKSTNKFTVFTVLNFDRYQQSNQQPNQQINQRVTTNKNDKEDKEEKKEEQQPDEIVITAIKKTNRISLTRSQALVLLKEFPTVTSDELREQVAKCNDYMTLSSDEYKNPGLFFRGWLKRYAIEKTKRIAEEKRKQEALPELRTLSDEEMQKNIERLNELRTKFKVKGVSN